MGRGLLTLWPHLSSCRQERSFVAANHSIPWGALDAVGNLEARLGRHQARLSRHTRTMSEGMSEGMRLVVAKAGRIAQLE